MFTNYVLDLDLGSINNILYMDNYSDDCEYFISTRPGYTCHSESLKDFKFVTIVYSADPLVGDVYVPPLEIIPSETEEEAQKNHKEMLDKWNNIQYSQQIEVADEEVQDWRFSDVFSI